MFLLTLTRLCSGYVKCSLFGGFPERFFNLCAQHNRAVWNMTQTGDGYEVYLLAKDYKRLRAAARTSGVRMRVMEKHGLPFFIRRYRFRPGMAVGLGMFIGIICFLSLFVWNIEVTGNTTIATEDILAAMENSGIRPGVRISSIDANNAPQQIILNMPEISWMSLNIQGTNLIAEVSERKYAPERVDQNNPCDLVALRDGRIVDMQVLVGEAAVQEGDAVVAGDLLVRGTLEYSNGTTVTKHAAAEITAETVRSLTVKIPRTQTVMQRTGKVIRRSALEFFHLDIPLFLGSVRGSYDKEVQTHTLSFGGVPLPIRYRQGQFYETVAQEVTYTTDEMAEQAREKITSMADSVLQNARILSSEEHITEQEDGLTMTIQYRCEEDIVQEQEILLFP